MEFKIQPGKYVVAVSGGVDSVVLLDLLASKPELELVVAHFDHGIRPDSSADERFVRQLAADYGLTYVSERAELGTQASEATARQARYNFLRRVKKQTGSPAIITAHHQDDVLETAILNLLRGTGRLGLTSLSSRNDIVRPLLHVPKQALKDYAVQHKLSWREDTTNRDERYTRNYIRHRLLVKFDAGARQQLLAAITQARTINEALEPLLGNLPKRLERRWFNSLPHDVAREVLASWLRQQGVADFDRRTIERLTVQAKVKPGGRRLDVLHGVWLAVGQGDLRLEGVPLKK